MKNKPGKIFVLEGIDSSGKTTLCEMIKEELSKASIPTKSFHFPGKDMNALGNVVYQIHHSQIVFLKPIPPLALQTLHIAAHIDLWHNYINEAIEEGFNVILDRFWWSTYAYGKTSSISKKDLKHLIEIEKSCYKNKNLCHFFYIIRYQSPHFDEKLNSNYLELTMMPDFKNKTTVIYNDSEIEKPFNAILGFIIQNATRND